MPNVEKQRERLISLLKELFQLDQPDLDFGFYRIMHAKAGQVTKFLEEDLLGIIRDAFGEADGARVEQAKAAYEAARKQAEEFGAPDLDAAPKVKEAKAAWDAAKDSGSNEGDVYDHLYRFFERYYDSGDFMSRRYFARETDGKAAPYAVPYDGREVYLHWANRDQYYIKTSEYLTNFTFDPTQAKEFQAHHGALVEQRPLKVHCRIVSASEGEHNNVKASEQTERYFIIHEPEPVKIETGDTGEPELVIQFQYRPDPEKTGQEGTWRKTRLAEAARKVKELLPTLEGAGDYVTALMTPAPTEAEKDRSLLEKYLAQYTGRNTMDYFIHKDLGGFLRRELDFYIKNEVMRLDDIESADVPRVEVYLAKVKVLRRIARHLIDFLAQLEDFQKRLWLKKKFVVDTHYCITLDRIPEEFYPEIAANEAQREEWVRLFAIEELDGYSSPLTTEFLENNRTLLVDTGLFGIDFQEKILSRLEDIERNTGGALIHSENFQALNLMKRAVTNSVKYIYIDPPYNTDSTPILYKNAYRHSSWASLIKDRLSCSLGFLKNTGVLTVAIDDTEMVNLSTILEDIAPDHRLSKVTVVHNPKGSITKDFNRVHEYALFLTRRDVKGVIARSLEKNDTPRKMRRWGENSRRTERRLSFYPIYVRDGVISRVGQVPPDDFHPEAKNIKLETGEIEIWPIDQDGVERRWNFGLDSIQENLHRVTVLDVDGMLDLFLTHELTVPKTVWSGGEFDAGNYGNTLLINMLGDKRFDFPKSIKLVEKCVHLATDDEDNALVLDYFSGSGTTGHAVVNINRRNEKRRRFILVEMGGYFDVATKPRVLKAIYSSDWRDGKPVSRDGESYIIKCIRLESYEDALNNIELKPSADMAHAGKDFARDYMLRYWLDFETKGSPSLLNIEWFDDPTAYKLKIKKPGTDEYVEKAVDLVETFNWLIGLHVEHLDRWRGYDAAFKREVDPELPEDTNTRLMLDGALKETDDGAWRFRKVEGYTLRTPGDHNDREKALVVWRKLTGDLEQDNLMLDEWFRKYRLSAQDTEFDVIYVNGSNNLPNLRRDEETWKVRLIEEAFHQAMWDVEG
ncbi:site-specific DNA-methyltransferase [Brucella anthropi]|uniref:DNA methyltransferase n=1 Tax=Brucella anthropi TaxID=529 RepID=UPI00124ED2C1|nr:DNA methyltransferase [Brucella anthropi]KAB2787790.1 site-specific DNA-methyltransferase [Brucella anthropi]